MPTHPSSDAAGGAPPLNTLDREEYVEQAHFFGVLLERLKRNEPAQQVLSSVREEILATTKLPLAIDFMLSELRHAGGMAEAVRRLSHYFTSFQAFILEESENERRRFDLRVALEILQKEAEFRSAEPSRQGLFFYQFESLCRNRLGYDRGLLAMSDDPGYGPHWQRWMRELRHKIGAIDLADIVYVNSELYHEHQRRKGRESPDLPAEQALLFGEREGRIALANRRKDPLYLFSSLHRHLGYPAVPRQEIVDREQHLLPAMARRVEHLEARVRLLEDEIRGGIDITKFYGPQQGS